MRIALVSDYFYPAFGGVESHIIGLANVLKRRGHEVIVITHQYETDKGILGIGSNLKFEKTSFFQKFTNVTNITEEHKRPDDSSFEA